jgi:hypothetical protein
MSETLSLVFFETPVAIHCESELTRDILLHMYGAFQVDSHTRPAELVYTVGGGEDDSDFYATRTDQFEFSSPYIAQFMYHMEKDMTIQWEYARADLYFLHASALEFGSGVVILAGSSGNGKSTTCWAMTNNGFGYLSDELAPINLNTMQVHPFPHSLCLKSHPPAGYELPETILDAGPTLHVSPLDIATVVNEPRPIRAVLFVQYDPELDKPQLTRMSAAVAATNLFTHALNPLAHANDGLAAAAAIVKPLACAELRTAGLDDTCELIREFLRTDVEDAG